MKKIALSLSILFGSIASFALLSGCQISTSFESIGQGAKAFDPDSELLVVVTHAQLHSKGRGEFYRQTNLVADDMKNQPGLIGHSIRRTISGDRAWTMTIWKDEASMNAFVRDRVHRTAIKKGDPALADSDFHRFFIPAGEAPLSWSQAFAKILETDGVNYAE